MTENCTTCSMKGRIERIEKDVEKGEAHQNETDKVVYEIKESHSQTRFLMEQIQKNQEAQSIASEKREAALLISNEKNQEEVARTNKDINDKLAAGFKAIEDQRIADEKIITDKKAEAEKEAVTEKKAEIKEKEADRKAKKATRIGIYVAIFLMAVNFGMGILVKYAPTLIGLPAGH